MLWLTFFFNQQAVGYISTMYKPFGQTFIKNDRYLSIVGSIAALFNSFGRIFWGKLMDDTSYKVGYLISRAPCRLNITWIVTECKCLLSSMP